MTAEAISGQVLHVEWPEVTLDEEAAEALRAPFEPWQIGKLPKAGTFLDFVGHGFVTDRLLQVDPAWTWEPLGYDEQGLPAFVRDQNGNPTALWIRLTVLGVTKIEVGSVSSGFDREKQLVSDALRRAAMRFGVALDLWCNGSGEEPDGQYVAPAPIGFDSHDEWSKTVAETKQLAKNLPTAEKLEYAKWFDVQGFVQPWDRVDCDRMLGKITELASRPEEDSDVLEDGQ